jgi:transcriptional regulator with XRE-family HTH domain
MDRSKREALERAGWKVGDAGDFLDLQPRERELVELRLAFSRAVAARRRKSKLTQAQAAELMDTSQPRFNRIENGSQGVSIELMLKALHAMGGSIADVPAFARSRSTSRRARVTTKAKRSPGVKVQRSGNKTPAAKKPLAAKRQGEGPKS